VGQLIIAVAVAVAVALALAPLSARRRSEILRSVALTTTPLMSIGPYTGPRMLTPRFALGRASFLAVSYSL
jgi:hypothetical protein